MILFYKEVVDDGLELWIDVTDSLYNVAVILDANSMVVDFYFGSRVGSRRNSLLF